MVFREMYLLSKPDFENLQSQKQELDKIHINQLMFNEGEKINVRHDVKNGVPEKSTVVIDNKKSKKKAPIVETNIDSNKENTSTSIGDSTQELIDELVQIRSPSNQPNITSDNTTFRNETNVNNEAESRSILMDKLSAMKTRNFNLSDENDDRLNNTPTTSNIIDHISNYTPTKRFADKSVMTDPIDTRNIGTSPINQPITTTSISTSPISVPNPTSDSSPIIRRNSMDQQNNRSIRTSTPIREFELDPNFSLSTSFNKTENDSTVSNKETSKGNKSALNKSRTLQQIIDDTSLKTPTNYLTKSFTNRAPHQPKKHRLAVMKEQPRLSIRDRIEKNNQVSQRAKKLVQLGQANIDKKKLQKKSPQKNDNKSQMRRLDESKADSPAVQGSLQKQFQKALNEIESRANIRGGLVPDLKSKKVRPSSVNSVMAQVVRNLYNKRNAEKLDETEPLPSSMTSPKRPKRNIFPTENSNLTSPPLKSRLRSREKRK